MMPRGRFASSVLVFLVPLFVMSLLGAVTGSIAVGTPEVVLLWTVWIAGLTWVWWPRRSR